MIRNPELFARASEWSAGLITYPNGYPRATDLDSISQAGEKFVVIEAKRIFMEDLAVPRGQFMVLSELHRQLKQPHFSIVGTYGYDMCKPEDIMYYADFKKILTKEIPHSYDKYGNLVLNVKNMIPISRRGFSAICDNNLK